MEKLIRDRRFFKFLEDVDQDMADVAREEGCDECGGETLHRGDYPRKPRGGPEWDRRFSFCCAKEGCRKRKTPASVRFLGRRVYAGLVVVLVSAMVHGMKPTRVARLREGLGISERTLKRWRAWWLETFVNEDFWRVERARFSPRLTEALLPQSLVDAFDASQREGLMKLMRFLSPITVPMRKEGRGM